MRDDSMEHSDAVAGVSGSRGTVEQDGRSFTVRGHSFGAQEILRVLRPYISDVRAARIDEVLRARTRSIVPVVEGAANLGNIGAVMRTAEAFGLLDFHVILSEAHYKRSSRTTQGADKWIDVFSWSTSDECVDYLRRHGYRLLATGMGKSVRAIDEVDFTKPTAIVFGNEVGGLSSVMREAADEECSIPMLGFVESLNISVAAAICLEKARTARFGGPRGPGDLSDVESERLRAAYYLRSVRHAESLLDHYAHARPARIS
jgi:tRNA (guanosine-2'-O-)-methyltransferase